MNIVEKYSNDFCRNSNKSSKKFDEIRNVFKKWKKCVNSYFENLIHLLVWYFGCIFMFWYFARILRLNFQNRKNLYRGRILVALRRRLVRCGSRAWRPVLSRLERGCERGGGTSRRGVLGSQWGLKGSIGDRSYHSNFSHQNSVKILVRIQEKFSLFFRKS